MGLRDYISFAAKQYGADPGILDSMAKLESGYRPTAVNNWSINAKNGTPNYGVMQFMEPTFNSFAKQAKQANPNAWKNFSSLDWKNPAQQILTAAWAIKNGKGGHWSTYGRAQQAAGNYNYTPRFGSVQQSGGMPQPGVAPPPVSTSDLTPQQLAEYKKRVTPLEQFKPRELSRQEDLLLRMTGQRDLFDQVQQSKAADSLTRNEAIQNTNRALLQSFMTKNTGMQNAYQNPRNMMGSAPDTVKNPVTFLEQFLGLKRSSSDHDAAGVHTEGSFHYQQAPWGGVRAYDYGDAKNNPALLKKVGKYLLANNNYKKLKVNEFFYDPLGWYIDNGKVVKGSIGGHGDHVHLAF